MQPDLFSVVPVVDHAQVDRLMQALTGRGWVLRRQLEQQLGIGDRMLRACASESEGRVISGQRGYCLIEEATVEDANHAAAWLERQAKAMAQRSAEIRRAMHRRVSSAA